MSAIPLHEVWARLAIAAVLGGAIGLEREYRRKPAGLRTNILIALGSALFSMLSFELGTGVGTPDRIAAQIVTGIGFLGAGAILRSGENVHGLTTAATIWVNAAIGMASGLGSYALAITTAAIALVVLAFMPLMERLFERQRQVRHFSPSPDVPERPWISNETWHVRDATTTPAATRQREDR